MSDTSTERNKEEIDGTWRVSSVYRPLWFSDPCILSNFPVSGALRPISTFVNRHSLNFRALAHILVVQVNGELTILRFSHLTGFNPDRQTATPVSF